MMDKYKKRLDALEESSGLKFLDGIPTDMLEYYKSTYPEEYEAMMQLPAADIPAAFCHIVGMEMAKHC